MRTIIFPVAPYGLTAARSDQVSRSRQIAAIDPRIRLVEDIMHHHLSRTLSLGELAQRSGVSVSRLAHLFKSELGISPKQYLKSLRIGHAKYLLESSSLSVKEVAAQVGLTAGALIRQFRRAYGTPPGRHRQDLNAANLDFSFDLKPLLAEEEASRIGI